MANTCLNGLAFLSIAALWVKECIDAWKQYRAARP